MCDREVIRLLSRQVVAEFFFKHNGFPLKSASQSSGWTFPPWLVHSTYKSSAVRNKVRAMVCVTQCVPVGLEKKQGLNDVLLPQQTMHRLKPASSVLKPKHLVCSWSDTLSPLCLSIVPPLSLCLSQTLFCSAHSRECCSFSFSWQAAHTSALIS